MAAVKKEAVTKVTAVVKQATITKWTKKSSPLVEKAGLLKVNSVASDTSANEIRKEIKRYVADIESELNTDFVEPQQDARRIALKVMNNAKTLYARVLDPCKKAIAIIDKKILTFQREEERKAEEAEAERQAELDRLEDARIAAEEKARKLKTKPAKQKALALADELSDQMDDIEDSGPVVAKVGESTVVKRWIHEVVDETKVPRAYMSVDGVAIGKAVRDGIRTIAGVRIYQKTTMGGRFR